MLTNVICVVLVVLCGLGMQWVRIREQERRDAKRKVEREEERRQRQVDRASRATSAPAPSPASHGAQLRNRLIANGTIRPGNSH